MTIADELGSLPKQRPTGVLWETFVAVHKLPPEWAKEPPTEEEWALFRRKAEVRLEFADAAVKPAKPKGVKDQERRDAGFPPMGAGGDEGHETHTTNSFNMRGVE